MTAPRSHAADIAGSLLSKTAVAERAPGFGLSPATRLIVDFSDGTAAFVKEATTAETADWLRREHHVLGHLRGTGLAPRILGWRDDGASHPLLMTEDLSDAFWPAAGIEETGGSTSTLWRAGDIEAVFRALDRLRETPLPDELPPTTSWPVPEWSRVIALADRLVQLGVVAPGWLEANAELLVSLDAEADQLPELGTHLVHGDVRSDNMCVLGPVAEREVRLVDWSHGGAGHPSHDLVQLLPTLHLEGGPPPAEVCTEPVPLIVRLAAGSLLRACVSEQPAWLRQVFVSLAFINLTWLAAALELPPPGVDALQARLA